MAMKLDAGDVSRENIYRIAPEEIIAPPETNGREKEHDPEDVQEMVESILEYGQQNPAVGRKVQGNKVQLVSGFRRLAAIKQINALKLTPEPLKLRVSMENMNDEEAFLKNLVENMHRKDLNPLDHAHNQRVLRERYHWDEEKIAKFYKHSRSYTYQLQKLVQLPNDLQNDVKSGELPAAAAMELVQLPAAEQREVVAEAKGTNGKIDKGKLKKGIRNKVQAAGGAKALTMKEVREFLEALTGPAEKQSVREVAETLLKLIAGRIREDTAERKIREAVR